MYKEVTFFFVLFFCLYSQSYGNKEKEVTCYECDSSVDDWCGENFQLPKNATTCQNYGICTILLFRDRVHRFCDQRENKLANTCFYGADIDGLSVTCNCDKDLCNSGSLKHVQVPRKTELCWKCDSNKDEWCSEIIDDTFYSKLTEKEKELYTCTINPSKESCKFKSIFDRRTEKRVIKRDCFRSYGLQKYECLSTNDPDLPKDCFCSTNLCNGKKTLEINKNLPTFFYKEKITRQPEKIPSKSKSYSHKISLNILFYLGFFCHLISYVFN